MSRSSIKYIDTTYMYGQKVTTSPVTNPVVYGHFPKHVHKKSAMERINQVLSGFLLCLVVLSLVTYYYVSDGQKTMNNLGREIVALSNENIELQNKLDNLNSFNRVDSIVQNNMTLDTAKKVIEIPAVKMISTPKMKPIPVNYHWSMGY